MQDSETSEQSAASRPQLKREMGLWMAIALVVGNMVGSLALVFARHGRAFPRTGGPRCMSCPIERDALANT